MIIIGAGLAGLICATAMQSYIPTILEAQADLPNNHRALLRFRTDKVSQVTKIPFSKVIVRKAAICANTYLEKPNPYACNLYSYKVTGTVTDRSIWNLDSGIRYIAPDDFTELLYRKVHKYVRFNHKISSKPDLTGYNEPIISTIPMPILMHIMGWPHIPKFRYQPIWSLNGEIKSPEVNVCQTIYYPDLDKPYYRASIVGKRFIVEFSADIENPNDLIPDILDDFGIKECELQIQNHLRMNKFGKILPIDDEVRKDFIYTMSREHNIYSLGRFATWRQILLDDLIQDIGVIEQLLNFEGKRKLYHQKLVTAKH